MSPTPTPTARVAAPAGAPAAAEAAPVEVWRRIRAGFEEKRPRLAALLAHAEIGELAAGRMSLLFRNRADAEAGEKVRAEIEQAVAAGFGQVVRLVMNSRDAAPGPAAASAIRSEVAVEEEAQSVDRKNREAEARQHPMIKKAQNLFGASLKEIKT
jgi:hypothetical protein